MFSVIRQLWSAPGLAQPRRKVRQTTRKLCVESLEERAMLSAGPVLTVVSSGGQGPQLVASTSVGGSSSGGTGSSSISGPGYPIAPTTGPTRPDGQNLTQQGQGTSLVGVSGTPGGPTVAVIPVCTGSGAPGATE